MSEHYDKEIRDWLQGKLPESQQLAFEKRLREDADFAREVEFQKAEHVILEAKIEAESRQLFAQWSAEPLPKTGRKTWGFWFAAMVGLLVAAWFFYNGSISSPLPNEGLPKEGNPAIVQPPIAQSPINQSTNQAITSPPIPNQSSKRYLALAEQHYVSPVGTQIRTSSGDSGTPLQRAQGFFEQKNYDSALEALKVVDSTQQLSTNFLRGHTLFKLKKFDLASLDFQRLAQSGSRQYAAIGAWMYAVCLVAQCPDEKKAAIAALKTVATTEGHPYQVQAERLLKALK